MSNIDKYAKVKELLQNYEIIKISIANIEKEIEYIKEDIAIRGISYDGVSTSPTNEIKSIVESTILAKEEKINYLQHLIKRHQININKIDDVLNNLTETERTIIIDRYMHHKYWYQITPKVFLEERQCRRKLKSAMDKMIIGVIDTK